MKIDLRNCSGNPAHAAGIALKAMQRNKVSLEEREEFAKKFSDSQSPHEAWKHIFELEKKGYEVVG